MNIESLFQIYQDFPFRHSEEKIYTGVLLLLGLKTEKEQTELLNLYYKNFSPVVDIYIYVKQTPRNFQNIYESEYDLLHHTRNVYFILTEVMNLSDEFDFNFDDNDNLLIPKHLGDKLNPVWEKPPICDELNYEFQVFFV